jgi:hypothetical protein
MKKSRLEINQPALFAFREAIFALITQADLDMRQKSSVKG